MPIQEQDIQILKSQVLADVPEGGGAATGNQVVDGASNNLFPDVSELDRVYGAVNARKVFLGVRTPNTDGYYGAKVIVLKPPADPDVSCLLFSTGDDFDRRTAAADRIESYLAPGAEYAGYLFGNHLEGQMSVTLLQRVGRRLPTVGSSLVLRKNEGLVTEYEQFIRITNVAASERTFTDSEGDFVRVEVVLDISDELGQDFNGFNAVRRDADMTYTGKTKLLSTIVADASRYYGISPLQTAGVLGDYTVRAESIYARLVPSNRIEVPVADARMNQQSATLVKAGDVFSRMLTMAFTTTQAMYVGGRVLPGSLSIVRGGVTLTDRGGSLIDASDNSVGTVDYENGVLNLATNAFGTSSGAHTVSYSPASAPTLVGASAVVPVTEASQRLTYTLSLVPAPARGTLQVDFRAQGQWYSLRDDGSGALRGGDSSAGAGTLNYDTGTITVTLGALPDVGSKLVMTYTPAVVSRPIDQVPPGGPSAGRRFGKPVDLGGAIKPGTLSISWSDGTARTATDVDGVLTGDATGEVNYAEGVVFFCPHTLPALGTEVTATVTEAAQIKTDLSTLTDGGANWTGTLPAPLKANTVEVSIIGRYPTPGETAWWGTLFGLAYTSVKLFDDGAGNLLMANVDGNLTVGTVDYSTGAISIPKSISGFKIDRPTFQWSSVANGGVGGVAQKSYSTISVELNVLNGPGGNSIAAPSWAWWTGSQSNAIEARYAGNDGTGISYPFDFDTIFMPSSLGGFTDSPGQRMDIVSFNIGASFYAVNTADGSWMRDPSPTSGVGTEAGAQAIVGGVSGVLLTSWPAGASSTPTAVAGATATALSGVNSLLVVDSVTFRTSISPLVNGGFNVAGNWSRTGAAFSVTADEDGIVASGTAVVGETPGSYGVFGIVDYEMGIAELHFGRRVPASMATDDFVIDLTSLGVPGLTYLETAPVQADTLRYNAVGYSYIPLDPEILGLNTVRLPSDGRVPIFRPGTVAVVHHTDETSAATVSNGQTINVGRTRLSRARVIGADDQTITAGYTTDLDAGTVTFTDVAGYSQPVRIEHHISDAALVSSAQINGTLRLNRRLTHDFPLGSYVSSALVIGNMFARVSSLFDQATWSESAPVWSDDLQGGAAGATYNSIDYPPTVTNESAVTERWALVFNTTTTFRIYGEHLGLIGTGNTSADCAPLNPNTGEPYFFLDRLGFGSGWAIGNAIRINTVGALAPLWWLRVIQQGVATEASDSATIMALGDIDTP
jgi:hypothetical protein